MYETLPVLHVIQFTHVHTNVKVKHACIHIDWVTRGFVSTRKITLISPTDTSDKSSTCHTTACSYEHLAQSGWKTLSMVTRTKKVFQSVPLKVFLNKQLQWLLFSCDQLSHSLDQFHWWLVSIDAHKSPVTMRSQENTSHCSWSRTSRP